MIIAFSRRSLAGHCKLLLKLLAVVIILTYVLPCILGFVWDACSGTKSRDERLPEKPLRVISLSADGV